MMIQSSGISSSFDGTVLDCFGDGSCINWYKFNSNVLDESGNYNGTATNVTYGTGVKDNCAIFNGSSSRVTTSKNFWNMALPRSMSFWIKGTPNAYASPLSSVASGSGYLQEYPLGSTNVNVYSTGNVLLCAYSGLLDNAWHHIVISQTSGGSTFYKDGTLYTTGGADGTNSATTFSIGAYNTGSQYFKGSLDELRMFTKALTSGEAYQLYTA